MLQKESSNTKSSKSATPKQPDAGVFTPVQFVKGVGPRLGQVLSNRNIHTVFDLLSFFPRQYDDRSRFSNVAELVDGESATVALEITSSRRIPLRGKGRSMFEANCFDESGTLALKWFYTPHGLDRKLVRGAKIIATGKTKTYLSRKEMVHPEITFGMTADVDAEKSHNVGRIIPVYSEIEGVHTRTMRKVLWNALEAFSSSIRDEIPKEFLAKHQLPSLKDSIQAIHFPPTDEKISPEDLIEFNSPYHHRLIYDEFFKFEFAILKHRFETRKERARSFDAEESEKIFTAISKKFPFKLTDHQSSSIGDILKDISENHPMNRMIQGDVGSGKTAVAFSVAACILAQGGQAVLMAPTEILAEQHYKNALKLFGTDFRIELLTGTTPASARQPIIARLQAGEPTLLIGTHAVFEDPIEFKNLDFVIIDEQQRFGVAQRQKLRQKGVRIEENGEPVHPHVLVLTATPIPRTLALTVYGDLSVSVLKEMPAGRSPILTRVVDESLKPNAYEEIRAEIKSGRQAYFIYPLVNDSEAEGFTNLRSVTQSAETLQGKIFPEFKVGVLHGQMSSKEKSEMMSKFSRNEVQILVSTTVVEVGVDVPNATIMVIEHAERFGLSQLHQLRGRVGRGSHQSRCYLFASQRKGENSSRRLSVLEKTTDGFKIAEADLEIRGPGEFLGTRQSGLLPFKIASLVRDQTWLLKAREDVIQLLQTDADLVNAENTSFKSFFEREGRAQYEKLKTS